ncbi:MAG: cytochrome c1 [Proteobacteria bacterium]|nr:cytochrome c1 [Pseudomonadota bacterium]
MPRFNFSLRWLGSSLSLFFAVAASAAAPDGELLLGSLNCTACHVAGPTVNGRLAPNLAPRLGKDGAHVTPQWVRAWLTDPQAAKPGTTMPDALHALPPAERTEATEALTHFVLSLQPATAAKPAAYSTSAVNAGRELFHTVGCVACHAPLEGPVHSKEKVDVAALAAGSAPLGDLARKFTVGDLAAFLRDPVKTRSSGRMPSLRLNEGEARAIATYLLRAQVPAGTTVKLAGLSYEYFEPGFTKLADLEKATAPKATGVADAPTLKVALKPGSYGLRFRGTITIPKDGEYTFYTDSDDGSALFINEKRVVNNDGIHPPQSREGKVTLKAGEHAFGVDYFDGGGGAELKVSWKGPGIGKQEIPASVFSHDGQPMRPVGDAPFAVDASKAARGKELFASLGCAGCHQTGPERVASTLKAPPFTVLKDVNGGCLANTPTKTAPKFKLSDDQRQALRTTLAAKDTLNAALEPKAKVARTLTQLNCVACHLRDGQGGPGRGRAEYFSPAIEADLGDEGRIPPHLTGVGNKLRPEWLEQTLWKGGAVRPYMATRMPQFGEANVKHLVTGFAEVDVLASTAPAPATDPVLAKQGHKLAGTGGLSCIACHNFAGKPSLGVPALDLTTVPDRLNWDWFRRYLLNPQVLRPGTRMPPFWPDGKAANRDILGGDTEKQVAALWAFLGKGKLAELPPGLITGKLELVATNEALIYRNFIEGAGSRAIGVAFPEKVNFAFDANELRLALVWQGPFIDAARHRTGRGVGYEPPLGYNVVKWAPGPQFALLDSPGASWPAETGRSATGQFRGYTLDAQQRPAFRYTFGDVNVEDYATPLPGEADTGLRRTLTLHSPKPVTGLQFRAAVGAKIEDKGNGTFLVDGKVRLKLTGGQAFIRESGGKQELLVAVEFKNGEAKLVEELAW